MEFKHADVVPVPTTNKKDMPMVWVPDHPNCHQNGYYPQSRLVMEQHLGRYLRQDEFVRHKDGDKANNSIKNLMVVDPSENGKLSHETPIVEKPCELCGELFLPEQNRIRFCSPACAQTASRKAERPSREELEKLVWQYPSTHLGAMFGVSDRCIKKWCDAEGIEKPPRGYWARLGACRPKRNR